MATHTDSKSGCVHNHIVFANHDTQTKKAAPRDMRNWYKLRNINDELMRDLGMRVLEREPEISLLPAERRARKEGKSTDSTGLGVDELTAATWADLPASAWMSCARINRWQMLTTHWRRQ